MRDEDKKDFFISYANADGAWAHWIAWQLERAGYSTFIQAWDFVAGQSFVHQMRQALVHCERTIAVLTPRYLALSLPMAEWSAAFTKDPTGTKGLLLPVRVEECDVEGVLGSVVFIDIVGLDEAEARRRLLGSIERQRAEPSLPPAFPSRTLTSSVVPAFPQAKPRFWNLPPRDAFFLDREELLDRLRIGFATTSSAMPQAQVLTGVGGSGKSAVAIEYAYRAKNEYNLAWLLRAETEASVAASVASLAQAINLPEREIRREELLLAAVRQWLEADGPWLLIFDGADEPNVLEPFLLSLTSGHVLITSRNRHWRDPFRRLLVDSLPRGASTSFLKEYTRQDDAIGAERVAAACGDLPLVLRLAAAYCAKNKINLGEYADALERGYLGERTKISVAWELWFSQIEKDSPASIQLANLLAFFAPNLMNANVIVEHAGFLPEPLRSVAKGQMGFNEAASALERSSFFHRDGDALSLHPFAQGVIRDRLNEYGHRQYAEAAVALLDAALPDFPYGAWDAEVAAAHDSLDQHALAAAGHAEAAGVALETAARLFAKVGFNKWIRGNFAAAKAAFARALVLSEEALGPEHPRVASDIDNLGMVLKARGDLAGARACFERALAIAEKALGPDHPATATSVSNLGLVLHAQGDLSGARVSFERALAIAEKTFGPDHPATATSVSNLGLVLGAQGDLAGARASFERALAITEKVFGPDHPDVATRLGNLGLVLGAQGDLAGARSCFERALAVAERALGPEHPLLAKLLQNLATALWRSRDIRGAVAAIDRSLSIYRARSDRHQIAESEGFLAKMYEDLHEPEAAEEAYISALGNYEASNDVIGTSNILFDAARFYQRNGRYADAATAIVESIRRLITIRSAIPQTHISLAVEIRASLGEALFDEIINTNTDHRIRDIIKSDATQKNAKA